MSNKIFKLIVLLGFLLFLHDKSFKESYYNYDSIPYVASAYMLAGNDIESSHRYAWDLLKKRAHPAVFNDLCCNSSYRKSMHQNPQAFGSHLPSYRTKSLYILLIRLVTDFLGTDEFNALQIITFSSVVLMTVLTACLVFNRDILIYLSIFPLLFLMQIIPLTRLLTPDGLIAFMMVLSGVFFLKGSRLAGYSILLTTILIRQTNIILYALFLLFELRNRNQLRFWLLLSIGLLVYFMNSSHFDSLGYWKTYYSSLISMPDTFIGFEPTLKFSLLITTLIGKLDWMLGNAELNRLISLMLLLFVICLYKAKKSAEKDLDDFLIPLFFVTGSLISYILIPFPDFRIYAGYLMASAITLLAKYSQSNRT